MHYAPYYHPACHGPLDQDQRATMYDLIAQYHPNHFSVYDYMQLRELLRRERIPFTNTELKTIMLELGFNIG